jgi:hypothetical protein
MLEIKPTKTFRGTLDEVRSHFDEIPADSTVEIRVFEPAKETVNSENEIGDFGGRNLYEVFKDFIGTVEGGPPDLGENAEEYLAKSDFGVTRNLRDFPQ